MCRFRYMEKYLQIHSLEEFGCQISKTDAGRNIWHYNLYLGFLVPESPTIYIRELYRRQGNTLPFNYMVLVPEQFTMQTQQDLCTLHPNHGIMNIDVLSFGRLAHRIFEETGTVERSRFWMMRERI